MPTLPLIAQGTQVKHQALKQFLGLSDADLSRLQAGRSLLGGTLTDFQRRQLNAAAGVLREAWVYQAVSLGLIDAHLWPGNILCYDEMSSLGLQLSAGQLEKLMRLRNQPKALRLAVLTDSQLKRIASFEAQLELVSEAIDLGLIAKPSRAEPLCH